MIRRLFLAGFVIAMLPHVPCLALTAKQKMTTCQFGANDQKLQGAARKSFIAKCMSDQNDPRGSAGSPAGGAAPSTDEQNN